MVGICHCSAVVIPPLKQKLKVESWISGGGGGEASVFLTMAFIPKISSFVLNLIEKIKCKKQCMGKKVEYLIFLLSGNLSFILHVHKY